MEDFEYPGVGREEDDHPPGITLQTREIVPWVGGFTNESVSTLQFCYMPFATCEWLLLKPSFFTCILLMTAWLSKSHVSGEYN
jgi:hypothetical protein